MTIGILLKYARVSKITIYIDGDEYTFNGAMTEANLLLFDKLKVACFSCLDDEIIITVEIIKTIARGE